MGSSQNSLPITSRAGPMVYGCMYCASSYNNTLATLKFAGLLHSHLLYLLRIQKCICNFSFTLFHDAQVNILRFCDYEPVSER